jgi:ligand-binding sensor domain-containing protein/signal transduction histidine kinase
VKGVRFFLLILLLQVGWGKVSAQVNDLLFEHLTPKQGLSHRTVTSVLQDREGFIWLGTRDGLNRFDGYGFAHYEHDPTDSGSLSNNQVKCLYQDRSGTLWIGTEGGLNQLDKTTNRFTAYTHQPTKPHSLSDNAVLAIYEDRAGSLWIATYMGLNHLDRTTGKFALFEHSPKHADKWAFNMINAISEDHQGNLWVGTNQGLSRFDRQTHQFTRYPFKPPTDDRLPKQYPVTAILEDRNNRLWVATLGDGLKEFNPDAKTFQTYKANAADATSLSDDFLFALLEDSAGTLWVGTQHKGLSRFDPQRGQFQPYYNEESNEWSLNDNTVMAIYEDRAKVLWVGTFTGGVNKVDLLRKKFTHFSIHPRTIENIHRNNINALYADRAGTVWIGNSSGLNTVDKKNGRFINCPDQTISSTQQTSTAVSCIYEDSKENLWVGFIEQGLKRYDRTSQKFTTYTTTPGDSASLPSNFVRTVYEDKAGTLWVGTLLGLSRFDPLSASFTTYRPASIATLRFNVKFIFEDAAGVFWVVGEHMLYTFNRQNGQFTKYPGQDNQPQSWNKTGIGLLTNDRAGRLWIGLKEGGLYRLDHKHQAFTSATEPKALSKLVIAGIQEAGQGNLWLSTSKNGIYKYNPASKALEHYDVTDGLQGNEFNSASCKSPTGELFFGGKNGFNSFYPDSIQRNPFAPPVVISGFKVFDKPRNLSKEIILPYHDNFFSFDFVAMSYALPEKNHYAYQLVGFDPTWINSGSRRYASYTNMDPGSYVFKVKASNNDGVWNEQGTFIRIIIKPPWWRTWWAYGLYIIAFVGIVWGFIYYRSRQLIRQKRILEHKVAIRTAEVIRQKEEIQEINEKLSQQKEEIAAQRDQISHTLTELQATQAQLILKEKMASLGELTAGIAHEIENPLNFVNNFSEVSSELMEELKQEIAADHKEVALSISDDLTQNLSKIYQHGQRADSIVKGMMQHSPASIGDKRPTDLIGLIDERLWISYHSLRTKDQHYNATLVTDYDATLEKVNVVPQELGRAFLNLFNNAFYATQQKARTMTNGYQPEVKVSVKRLGKQVAIRIRDNGTGISPKVLDKIFQPFFTTKPTGQGTGLGLSLSYYIITKGHQGELKVETKEGEFAEFVVVLPTGH